TAQAHAAGNAIVVQVSCAGPAIPDAVTLTATGWTFQQLGAITASAASPQRSATLVAIAPNAVGTTFSVAWSGSNCSGSKNNVGDWSEYAITSDPADTIEPVEFDNDNVGYVLSMVTLTPR